MAAYPMKITSIAGRGLGVLSTRYLKPGQLILQEIPFARVNKDAGSPESRANPKVSKLMARVVELASSGQFDPRSEYGSWPSEVVHCFEGVLEAQADMVFEGCSSDRQEKWMELSDVHAADEKHKTPGGILRTNGVDDAEGHANLYSQMSRMNHSCAPNAVRVSTSDSGGVAVVSRKQIDEGEEVLINYMDGADDGKPVDQRRKHLMQQYHFHCTCPLCMAQEKK
uniref:SET domain-containing protein n=1 Tax=Minutocellus polymorphus TaxID=265543 RepID=A0A6U0IMD4_9STRA